MLARFVFGLVLGLIMYIPRPRGPELRPPGTPPSDEFPPAPGDDGPTELPPAPDGYDLRPVPDFPRRRHPGLMPSVPPTPPPGYEGDWPPASERPDVPPTPPPGHQGPWPDATSSVIDRLRELLRELRALSTTDGAALRDAQHGVQDVAPGDDAPGTPSAGQ